VVIGNQQKAKEMKSILTRSGSSSLREIWRKGEPPTIVVNIMRRFACTFCVQTEEALATNPIGSFAASGAD